MDDQRTDALSADPIDSEIARALDVNPSPEFVARIRARVSDESLAADHRWLWAGFAAAVTAAVLVLGVTLTRSGGAQAPIRPVTRETHVTPVAAVERAPVEPVAPAPVAPAARVASILAAEPRVLVARSEANALRQLLRAVDEGRLDPRTFPDFPTGVAELQPLAPIELPPLAELPPIQIQPLQSAARTEGAGQ